MQFIKIGIYINVNMIYKINILLDIIHTFDKYFKKKDPFQPGSLG